MNAHVLAALAPVESAASMQGLMSLGTGPMPDKPATGFAQMIERSIGDLNAQLVDAERALQSLAAGDSSNLHTVMLRLEEARLAMQVASQVKTRILEAYQEVMRMQV